MALTTVATQIRTIVPWTDHLVVDQAQAEELVGRIVVPDVARERPREGTVLAVGPGRVSEEGVRIPMSAQVGDRVVFGSFAGTEVTLDGRTLLVLREEDCFGALACV